MDDVILNCCPILAFDPGSFAAGYLQNLPAGFIFKAMK